MNRFRKQNHPQDPNEAPSHPPLREYKDDSQGTPPSMSSFRVEVTAYWLLPLIIFCVILFGGIFLVFKLDVFTEVSGDSVSPVPYLSSSGEILVPELLDSYLIAIGGREALEGIRSLRYKGRFIEASGVVTFQILLSLPDKGMIITNPGEEGSQKLVLNGDTAWQVVGLGDGTRKVLPLSEVYTASLVWSLRVHDTFRRLALEGRSEGFSVREIEFLDKPCYELTRVMNDGSEFIAVLDAANLFLLKTEETAPGAEGLERLEVVYQDHRLVSGIVEAHETKTYKDGEIYSEVFFSIEINPGLFSSLFEVPEEL